MTDPGLDRRLRQRSRRSGFMIGLSMALTIAVCVAGFSVIYAALDDTIGDFVSRDVPDPVVQSTAPPENQAAQEGSTDDEPDDDTNTTTQPEPEPTATQTEQPAANDGEFSPDYQSSFEAQLNFRTEPSTAGGGNTVIQTLPAGTLLEFTGNRQASDNPGVDGEEGWLQFELEDGTQGWLRAIDVSVYEP